jgi:hypothetical protein
MFSFAAISLLENRAMMQKRIYLLIRNNVPDTAACDSGHRPAVLEHCMMKSYNDCRDPTSRSVFAQHRADVGGKPRYRMRASGSYTYTR